jgi:hypothetical protein
MFAKQLLLLAEIKKLSKNRFLFRLDFILSLDQTIPGLLGGHCRYITAIGRNTTLAFKNIVVTITQFVEFNTTLAGIDVRNTKRFKK